MAARVTVRGEIAAEVSDGLSVLVGLAAVFFSALYFASDLIELAQGGFSTAQLALTYAAEAAIPLFVIGLYAVQRPRIGRLGLVGAVGYAYSFLLHGHGVVRARERDERLGRARRSVGRVGERPRCPDGARGPGLRSGGRPRGSAPPLDGSGTDGRSRPGGGLVRAPR